MSISFILYLYMQRSVDQPCAFVVGFSGSSSFCRRCVAVQVRTVLQEIIKTVETATVVLYKTCTKRNDFRFRLRAYSQGMGNYHANPPQTGTNSDSETNRIHTPYVHALIWSDWSTYAAGLTHSRFTHKSCRINARMISRLFNTMHATSLFKFSPRSTIP